MLRFEIEDGDKIHHLAGLFRSQAEAAARALAHAAPHADVIVEPVETPRGDLLWGIAVAKRYPPQAQTRFPRGNLDVYWRLAVQLERVFRAVEAQARAAGRPFVWRKPLEIDKVRQVFANVNWTMSLEDVAGSLVSRLIVAHALPNGNHRTALLMCGALFDSCGVAFPEFLQEQGPKVDKLYGRCFAFFSQSKYILQLLRRRPLFRTALEAGFRRFHLGENRVVKPRLDHCSMNDKQLHQMHLGEVQRLVQRLTRVQDRRLLRQRHPNLAQHFCSYLETA